MEDCNALAADCIVVSCCCQCLALRIIVFILLKIPYRLIQKTAYFIRKRFRSSRSKTKDVETVNNSYQDRASEVSEWWVGLGVWEDEFFIDGSGGSEGCMEEVENVLKQMSRRGAFAFGSFWGREDCERFAGCAGDHWEFDSSIVQFRLIEIVGSSTINVRGRRTILEA